MQKTDCTTSPAAGKTINSIDSRRLGHEKAKLFLGYSPSPTLTAFRKKLTEMKVKVKVNTRKEISVARANLRGVECVPKGNERELRLREHKYLCVSEVYLALTFQRDSSTQ
jgi:hypothetical protein